MSSVRRVRLGDRVPYLRSNGRWTNAKVTGVNSQTSVTLAIVQSNGTRVSLNGGAAVSKRTTHGQTNVWRPS
jgi:hypothetical protein